MRRTRSSANGERLRKSSAMQRCRSLQHCSPPAWPAQGQGCAISSCLRRHPRRHRPQQRSKRRSQLARMVAMRLPALLLLLLLAPNGAHSAAKWGLDLRKTIAGARARRQQQQLMWCRSRAQPNQPQRRLLLSASCRLYVMRWKPTGSCRAACAACWPPQTERLTKMPKCCCGCGCVCDSVYCAPALTHSWLVRLSCSWPLAPLPLLPPPRQALLCTVCMHACFKSGGGADPDMHLRACLSS